MANVSRCCERSGTPQRNGTAASSRLLARSFQAVPKSPSSRPAERPRSGTAAVGWTRVALPGTGSCGGCCGGCSARALAGRGLCGREGTAVCGMMGAASPRYLIAEGTAGAGLRGRAPTRPGASPGRSVGGSEPGWGAHGQRGPPRSAAAGGPCGRAGLTPGGRRGGSPA